MIFHRRLIVLCTGRVWHSTLTFNQPLQPLWIGAVKPFATEQVERLGSSSRDTPGQP